MLAGNNSALPCPFIYTKKEGKDMCRNKVVNANVIYSSEAIKTPIGLLTYCLFGRTPMELAMDIAENKGGKWDELYTGKEG